MTDWLKTPPGEYLLAWEREQFDHAVGDIFGYHALQLGFAEIDALRANRMPHQWLAAPSAAQVAQHASAEVCQTALDVSSSPQNAKRLAALVTDVGALPFPANSLDLLVLPHTLELSQDPHATLREVERVLVPDGRVVISGLNPTSLWAMRQRRAHLYQRFGSSKLFLPDSGEFIGYWRLRDWLRLLNFEVDSGRFGCYRPSFETNQWLSRFEWMDKAGSRWWPIFGAVYFLVAVKRVRGMRLLEPAWKTRKVMSNAPAVVANKKPNLNLFTDAEKNKKND